MKKTAVVRLQLLSAMSSLALAFGCGTQPTHSKVCGDDRGLAVEDCRSVKKRPGGSRIPSALAGGHAYVPLYRWLRPVLLYGRTYPGNRFDAEWVLANDADRRGCVDRSPVHHARRVRIQLTSELRRLIVPTAAR